MLGMRKGISRRVLLSASLFWSSLAAICPAQSFLFVSPNTRDHTSDESAANSLNSFEQYNFIAVANYLAAKLCTQPQVWSAEGVHEGTAENSSLVTGCENSQAVYLGELLGRYAHQKWVLIFDPSPKAREHLLIITFSSDHPADMAKELRQFRIGGATMVSRDKLVKVYLWVTDNSQDSAAHAFAQAEHGTVEDITGKGTLIGNDDRTAAQQIFDQRIRAYERAHHQSFSKLLWSKQLHDLGIAATGSASSR